MGYISFSPYRNYIKYSTSMPRGTLHRCLVQRCPCWLLSLSVPLSLAILRPCRHVPPFAVWPLGYNRPYFAPITWIIVVFYPLSLWGM